MVPAGPRSTGSALERRSRIGYSFAPQTRLAARPLPPMPERILLDWDGGAAAALVLRQFEVEGAYSTERLLLSVAPDGRVSRSGLSLEMAEAQAAALGKEVTLLDVPEPPTQGAWEAVSTPVLLPFVRDLVRAVGFPVHDGLPWRREMEHFLISMGMRGVFPLWRKDAREQCRLFRMVGLRAIVSAVDPRRVGEEHLGREWNEEFLATLPPGVDGFGTDGAFATFCTDGPIYRTPLAWRQGPAVTRGALRVLDLAPA
jgi:hypothetical protein